MTQKLGLATLLFVAMMAAFYAVAPKAQDAQSVGMRAARELLREPSSAEFRDVQSHTSRGGELQAICGQIRGKNLFGVMADYVGFVAVVRNRNEQMEVTALALEDVLARDSYDQAKRRYCHAGFAFY